MTKQASFTAPDSERERIASEGKYRPDMESDACGFGMVAAIDGKPSRRVVTFAIAALQAVWHRGAVDAVGQTGQGAGFHVALHVPYRTCVAQGTRMYVRVLFGCTR